MIYIVRPREGLRDLAVRPREKRDYFPALLQSRREQLEAAWARIAEELNLSAPARAGADTFMQILPGVGHLLVNDSHPRFKMFPHGKFERLEELAWLRVWRDGELPQQLLFQAHEDPDPWASWHLNAIKRPHRLSGAGVSIGVIDSGYDPTVEDLKAPFNAVKFADYQVGPGTMLVGPAPSDHSPVKHGSTVCAFLAGTLSGVAPNASIYVAALPVAASSAGNQTTVLKALDWLIKEPTNAHPDRPIGCDIITTSLHTGKWGVYDKAGAIDSALKDAFLTWEILVVGAIGNGGAGNWQCPGASQYVVGVGSIDQTGVVAFGSAWGDTGGGVFKPDIVAPGYLLELPQAAGTHTNVSGTSFAAPIVAGAAALILEDDPTLRTQLGTAGLLRTKLLGFTKQPSNQSGRGTLDLTGL